MVLKKHIGFTRTLIGILIPLFSTVCLASTSVNQAVSFSSINQTDNSSTLQKEEIPPSDLSIKPDVNFINRLMIYRLFFRNDRFVDGNELKHIPQLESFFTSFFSVPRPAYYNYLFMFKPFELSFFRL